MRVGLDLAVALLDSGQIVACATESSFALCARLDSEVALGRLQDIKPERNKPIAAMAANAQQAIGLWSCVPESAIELMNLWPGPLTLIAEAADSVPSALTAGTGNVGVRVPDHGVSELCRRCGPLTATSANPSNQPAARRYSEIVAYFPDLAVYGVCGPNQLPSTMVLCQSQRYSVLRSGAVAL